MRSVIVAGELENINRLQVTICVEVGESTCLRGRRQNEILPGERAWLLAHRKTAKKEYFVFKDWTADARAEVIQNKFIPPYRICRSTLSVVEPTIRIQDGIAKILISAAVICIRAPA